MIQAAAGGAGAIGRAAMRLWTQVGTSLGPLGTSEMAEIATPLAIGIARADRAVEAAIHQDARTCGCAIVPVEIDGDQVAIGRERLALSPEASALVAAMRKATGIGASKMTGYVPSRVRSDGEVSGDVERAASFLRVRGYGRDAEAAAVLAKWRAGA